MSAAVHHLNDHRAFAPGAANEALYLDLSEVRQLLRTVEVEQRRLYELANQHKAEAAAQESAGNREAYAVSSARARADADRMGQTIRELREKELQLSTALTGLEQWA